MNCELFAIASTCHRLHFCLSFDRTPYQFQRLGGKGNHIRLAISSQPCVNLTRYCSALTRNGQCYITPGEWRQSNKARNTNRADGARLTASCSWSFRPLDRLFHSAVHERLVSRGDAQTNYSSLGT